METQPDIHGTTVRGDAPDVGTGSRPGSLPSSVRDALVYSFKVWAALRLGAVVLGLLAVGLLEANTPAPVPGWPAPPQDPGWQNVFTAWERWDALWFLRIAADGYSASDFSAAFFPLYPLLIRGVSFVIGGHPLAAGLIVSNVAHFGALVVLYMITLEEFDKRTARRTVLLISVFPSAYFFVAPYTESVFLLLATVSLWAGRRGRWEIAGVSGALAAATRSLGLVLIPALAFEALRQYRRARDEPARGWRLVAGLAWSAFVSLGPLAYFSYWGNKTGQFFAPLSNQGGWLRQFSWPWETIVDGTRIAFQFIGSYPGGYHLYDWLIMAVVVAAAIGCLVRTSGTYSIYVWASLLLPLSLVFGGRPLMSLPRFALPMFPVFWVIARFADDHNIGDAVVTVFAAGLGLMTVLFVNWYFVF